jgi:hypothetical protein
MEHPAGETGNQGSEASLDLTTPPTLNNPYSLANASSQNSASSIVNAMEHPVGETGNQGSEASLQLVTETIDLLKDFTGG